VDKKPLIGVTICAVVLLVLGSLGNVVGYQSVKSTVNDSPLFTIRTRRATNQQQNITTSQYLGMEKGNLWQFPIRDSRTEHIKKAIDIISKMDDKTFERFTELGIQRIKQDKSLKDTNSNDIVKALKLMKTKPVSIIDSFINRKNQDLTHGTTICYWIPGCIPISIIILIMMFILDIGYFFTIILCDTFDSGCHP
jgi:hypothetical protein